MGDDGKKSLDYSNASKNAQQFLSAMDKTSVGMEAATGMAESKTDIKLKISNGKSSDGELYGETDGVLKRIIMALIKMQLLLFSKVNMIMIRKQERVSIKIWDQQWMNFSMLQLHMKKTFRFRTDYHG